MVIGSFLLGLVVSAILFVPLAAILGIHDTDTLIWFATSVIIATICGCSAWVVKSIKKPDEYISEDEDLGLVKLRDIEVLSNKELEEIIEIYHDKDVKKGDYKQYQKYEKVLNELKETGYFSDVQYSIKITELKKHFKVN
jgi:Na+/melibiose symporter-like transporter